MKKILVLAVFTLLLSTSAFAQATYVWDFNDGTFQGWSIYGRNTGATGYVAPTNVANPNINSNGTGSIKVTANRDQNWGNQMIFRLSDIGLSNVNKFRYSAQIMYDGVGAM
ncbi:MAG: hypothetical protein SNJ70_08425 [Armatimonadota bacterium]